MGIFLEKNEKDSQLGGYDSSGKLIIPAKEFNTLNTSSSKWNNVVKVIGFPPPNEVICPNLEVTILKSPGNFINCKNLKKKVYISFFCTMINGFQNCTEMEEITFPPGFVFIHRGIFDGCTKLKKAVFPESVFRIDDGAFINCPNLEQISLPFTKITKRMFDGFIGKRLVIPENVSIIEEFTFQGCPNLEEIVFPESTHVRTIRAGSFWGCKKLKKISIPDTIESIEDMAFKNCQELEKLIIPKGVKTINTKFDPGGYDRFGERIWPVWSMPVWSRPVWSRPVLFMGSSDEQLKKVYKIVTEKNSKLSSEKNPYYQALTELIVSEGTQILESAFSDVKTLVSVTLPDDLNEIPAGAFRNCINLKSINFPTGLVKIGDKAFEGCTSLPPSILERIKNLREQSKKKKILESPIVQYCGRDYFIIPEMNLGEFEGIIVCITMDTLFMFNIFTENEEITDIIVDIIEPSTQKRDHRDDQYKDLRENDQVFYNSVLNIASYLYEKSQKDKKLDEYLRKLDEIIISGIGSFDYMDIETVSSKMTSLSNCNYRLMQNHEINKNNKKSSIFEFCIDAHNAYIESKNKKVEKTNVGMFDDFFNSKMTNEYYEFVKGIGSKCISMIQTFFEETRYNCPYMPQMGENGCISFANCILLTIYLRNKVLPEKDNSFLRYYYYSNLLVKCAFFIVSPLEWDDNMDKIVHGKGKGIVEYSEYCKVYNYLRDNYANEIRRLDFNKGDVSLSTRERMELYVEFKEVLATKDIEKINSFFISKGLQG